MPTRLTENFTLDELTISQVAERLGLNNEPPPEVEVNLRRLALVLEEVRAVAEELLGGDCPIIVSSGYRSKEVNNAVGGSATSVHVLGLAADFIAPAFGTPLEVAQAIAESGIEFDQLIHEYGRWVHIGLAPRGVVPRRQLLTYYQAGRLPMAGLHEVA